MAMHEHPYRSDEPRRSFLFSPAGFVLIGFLIIAGALLFTEHRAHVLGVLIWLPVLACPLMHFFMHGRHGHGGHRNRSTARDGASDER
jgi:hypothetical protein